MNPAILLSQINHENFQNFVDYTNFYCEKHDKNITIADRKNVKMDGVSVSGWCDGDTMTVARKNELFEQVYVHEFAHLTQAVEGLSLWENYPDIWSEMNSGHMKISKWDDFFAIIALERDCESRALRLIKKFDIMNSENYAIYANLYLFYYQYVFLTNAWHSNKDIYSSPVIDKMPTKLLPLSHFKNINMTYVKMFDTYFNPKRSNAKKQTCL
jgi:hypothetical protein